MHFHGRVLAPICFGCTLTYKSTMDASIKASITITIQTWKYPRAYNIHLETDYYTYRLFTKKSKNLKIPIAFPFLHNACTLLLYLNAYHIGSKESRRAEEGLAEDGSNSPGFLYWTWYAIHLRELTPSIVFTAKSFKTTSKNE